MLQITFWFLIGLTTFIYFGYPAVIFLLARVFGKEPMKGDITPFVSVIIPAHNEEKVIRERVANVLSVDYPKDKLEIIFALDGCTDNTASIISEFSDPRIRVIDKKTREGKVKTLNRVVPEAKGEILVFSDANSMHKNDIIRKLIRYFVDEKVGCVCGCLKYKNTESTSVGKGESLYWEYEHFIKKQESRLGKLLVTNGSAQAIRKDLYPFPDPEVADDFSIPLLIQVKGYKLLFEPEAIVRETATQSLLDEMNQKIRIIAQGFKGTFMLWKDLVRLSPLGMFEFLFHKSLRWLIPFYLILAFIINLFLAGEPLYFGILLAQIAFFIFAFIGFLKRHGSRVKIFYVPFYFCLVNSASLIALYRFLKGEQTRMWGKAHSTRKLSAASGAQNNV
ncbi:MAG: glycosyltransferase family 2 protein [Candidatus Omnitrophota bacterium]